MYRNYLQVLLCLCITRNHAFRDTSPFLFFSTAEIDLPSPQITTSSNLFSSVALALSKCPTDLYVIASQPGADAADYTSHSGNLAPHLRRWMSRGDDRVKSSFAVSDVLGTLESGPLVELLEKECGAGLLRVDASTGLYDIVDSPKPRIIKIDFSRLPAGKDRTAISRTNDLFLANLLDTLPSPNFSVLYTTSPLPSGQLKQNVDEVPATYEMDTSMSSLAHMDLKRDTDFHERAAVSNGNITLVDGPLFERYQYFTPGLFMGLLAMFFLSAIMYVAIKGVASVQVSYGAFEKENGPAAQQKKQ